MLFDVDELKENHGKMMIFEVTGSSGGEQMNRIKRILCRIGWHSFGYDLVEEDGYRGICNKYRCRWCGYIGMMDSQGNLF